MTEKFDLRIERTLDAPRDLVWKAWTDPEHIKRWWAPRPYQTPECEIGRASCRERVSRCV